MKTVVVQRGYSVKLSGPPPRLPDHPVTATVGTRWRSPSGTWEVLQVVSPTEVVAVREETGTTCSLGLRDGALIGFTKLPSRRPLPPEPVDEVVEEIPWAERLDEELGE